MLSKLWKVVARSEQSKGDQHFPGEELISSFGADKSVVVCTSLVPARLKDPWLSNRKRNQITTGLGNDQLSFPSHIKPS